MKTVRTHPVTTNTKNIAVVIHEDSKDEKRMWSDEQVKKILEEYVKEVGNRGYVNPIPWFNKKYN